VIFYVEREAQVDVWRVPQAQRDIRRWRFSPSSDDEKQVSWMSCSSAVIDLLCDMA